MGINTLKKSPAVFLDRDGVVNRNVLNPFTRVWESPLSPEQVTLTPDAPTALRRMRDAGFLLFVVSNQPNYAKGKTSLEMLNAIHDRLARILQESQIEITAFYYCLHHPHGIVPEYSGVCSCRKPSPFFLWEARDSWNLDMENSWMIGDRTTDIECGRAAKVHTIRIVNTEEGNYATNGAVNAEFVTDSLAAAVSIILTAFSGHRLGIAHN